MIINLLPIEEWGLQTTNGNPIEEGVANRMPNVGGS
jgi:hypothetical protein